MGTYSPERQAVAAAYGGGSSWKKKVDAMSDSQIVAFYMRLKAQGKVK